MQGIVTPFARTSQRREHGSPTDRRHSNLRLTPNGSRLSCGALTKEQSFNTLRAASFKRLLGSALSGVALAANPPLFPCLAE